MRNGKEEREKKREKKRERKREKKEKKKEKIKMRKWEFHSSVTLTLSLGSYLDIFTKS
jgi:hypothetical protein